MPLSSVPAGCWSEGTLECETWIIGQLDAARASLGLPRYALPPDFTSLGADRQLLILADLDRLAYGYGTISGLNASLSEAAAVGVKDEKDPRPPAAEAPWSGFGSDWASTSALVAYYLWMYDDGYPGPNADCSSPSSSGCWGHRRVILGEGLPLPEPLVLGVATGLSSSGHAGTALIVSSHSGASVYYSWAQARQEGAGGEASEGAGQGGGSGAGGESGTGGGAGGESGTGGGAGAEHEVACTRARGAGTVASHLAHLHLVEELSTATHGAHRFEASITTPALGTLRLTGLSSATCAEIAGGHEFRGSGPASLRWSPGYHASFAIADVGGSASLSLEITKGTSTILKLVGIPFVGSSTESVF